MIHLKPAEGTMRFLCCFQSSLMLPPGDGLTDDPAKVDCTVEISYEAFEKLLSAPMDRYASLANKVQELIWELLVMRRLNTAFQVQPQDRRNFLEEFGQKLRKLEEDADGKDILLTIRKEQVKQLKALGKAYRDDAAQCRGLLAMVLMGNPEYPAEDIPQRCLSNVPFDPNCCEQCAKALAMQAHNALVRKIRKVIETNPGI